MYFPVCFAKNQLLVQLRFTSYSFKAIADLTQQPRGSRFPHSFGPAAVVEQCSSQHVVLCGWEKSTPIEIHGVWGQHWLSPWVMPVLCGQSKAEAGYLEMAPEDSQSVPYL